MKPRVSVREASQLVVRAQFRNRPRTTRDHSSAQSLLFPSVFQSGVGTASSPSPTMARTCCWMAE
ncbi:hypothetical protein SAMN02799622_04206 [Methylobacterium sp. UNC378MF]|nr:hypothetical protein SAMN02799622_04206 [Methylobacterium sp. UNC378MF]